jgi:hypothetical protein
MPKNIVQTFQGADMDITGYPKTLSKEKTIERITQEVKDTQLFVGRNFPDKVTMRKDQFQLLETDFTRMEDTEYRLYHVPKVGSVMEVYVIS